MITFDTIYTDCAQMASYEGQRAYDANGESMYSEVMMTEQDKPLLNSYAKQASELVTRALSHVIDTTSYDAQGFSVTYIHEPMLRKRSDDAQDIKTAICSYVMWQWLTNKLPQRAEVWKGIFDTSLESLPKIFYWAKPTLKDW